MPSLKYRRDIDGLRSLAVVPVVLNHAGVPFVGGGFVGVDIFFVISGFLIAGILLRELDSGSFSIVGFYERRARRILPALFAMLAVCFVAACFAFSPPMFMAFARSLLATVFFISNIWFLRSTTDYFAADSHFEPLLHTWSLAVEEQFYLLFPLLLWMFASRSRRQVMIAILLLCLLSFARSVWITGTHPDANFYLATTRAWELGLGALLAFGPFAMLQNRVVVGAVALAGLAAILAAIVLYSAQTPFPGLSAALPCLGAAAIIWSGGIRPTAVSRLLSLGPLVAIGLVSYSLYLWHWPVLVLFRLWFATPHVPLGAAMLAIAISLVLAWFSWRFVETPFRSTRSGRISRRGIFAFSAGGMVLGSAASILVIASGGLPFRVPDDALRIYAASADLGRFNRDCAGRTPAEGLCEIGKPSPGSAGPSVLLWGDSHAGAVRPGLSGLLADRGLAGLSAFKSACAPLLGTRRIGRDASRSCEDFNTEVMAFLRQRDDLGTVVLVGRWALSAEGLRAPGEAGEVVVLRRADDLSPDLDTAGNYAAFSEGLLQTVLEIRQTGRRVVIVEGLPEIGWDVPMILGNHRFFGSKLPPVPDRTAHAARNRRAGEVLRTAAAMEGVTLLPVASIMCSPVCNIESDGRALFSDDDHPSVLGSTLIIPRVFGNTFGP